MKILFLSRWFPYPTDNGSKLRIYNLLRGLSRIHDVSLLAFSNDLSQAPIPKEMTAICKKIQVFPWKTFNPRSIKSLFGFMEPAPRSIKDTYSPEYADAIQKILGECTYDIVIASQIDTAAYVRFFKHIPALFEEVEITFPYERFMNAESFRQRARSGSAWIKHRSYLKRTLQEFKACTVVSEREKELLQSEVHTDRLVEIIPNCIQSSDYPTNGEKSQPNTLIFTGSFRFSPNYEGMYWFVNEVYPIIQAKLPNVQLIITGDHADKIFSGIRNVNQTGFVDDIRPYVADAKVSLAPIFNGGGTRLKILESMAMRTPVVATTKGIEGLNVKHGVNILVADDPQDYAAAVIRLLEDPFLYQQISENGLKLVAENYDWNIVMPKFLNLVDDLVHA